jgi:hypothetical protein
MSRYNAAQRAQGLLDMGCTQVSPEVLADLLKDFNSTWEIAHAAVSILNMVPYDGKRNKVIADSRAALDKVKP